MSPHGVKGPSKKNKSMPMAINGPKISGKKKRKLQNENSSDLEVAGRVPKYWRGLKVETTNDLKEKIMKQLSCPSHRYKVKDNDIILPAKKKRKLQKNGSIETDSEEDKTVNKKGRIVLKKKQQYMDTPTSKLYRWKKLGVDRELSAVMKKTKKLGTSDSPGKGKKKRQKFIAANYEDMDGVCIYDLDTPEMKSKAKKKKLIERQKGSNHIVNKKKVRIGKCVVTLGNLGKKQKMKPKVDVGSANFKLLPKKQQKKLQEKYSLQLYSDPDVSDSDVSLDGRSAACYKKNKTKLAKDKWTYQQLLNKKKAKLKKEQELGGSKSKKSSKRQQVSEDDDSYENNDDDSSSDEEDISDEDVIDGDDDLEEEEDEEEDLDEDDDEEDDSEDQTSDEQLIMADRKSSVSQGLSNGDWEKVNDERCQDVNQDDYGSSWKLHDGETTTLTTGVLHQWPPHSNSSLQEQRMMGQGQQLQTHHPHQMPQTNVQVNMASSSNLLPTFGGVVDGSQSGHNHHPGISHPSHQHYQQSQHQHHQQQQFADNQVLMQDGSVQHYGEKHRMYNVYSNDYKSQTTHIQNSQADPDQQSQSYHLQQQLPLGQSQQNSSSSSVSKVKHYYPASFGKEGIMVVEQALQPVPPEEVLTQGFRISIKRCDMATLVGTNWLNDEIINFYMNLIVQRSKTEGYSSVYIPSTFFFPMVMKRGYSGVKRWTKNVDIFDHDLMLIPIHLEMENHWTLIAIDFLQSSICYYDSYLQDRDEAMDAVLSYLKEEMKTKKNIEMDTNCWVKVNMKNIPLQENLSDCGVFSCIYAEYISRGSKMDFIQEDMTYFRRKMVYEILQQKIIEQSPRDVENLISDEILEDVTCPDENSLAAPDTVLQNGLPDSSQSPASYENSTKISEIAGSAVIPKNMEDVSRDTEMMQSSSEIEEMEQKTLTGSGDERSSRKRNSKLVSEIKVIANLFDDANDEERDLLKSQLRLLLKSSNMHSNRKAKKGKMKHKDVARILTLVKGHSDETEESDDPNGSSGGGSSSSSGSSSSFSSSASTGGASSDEETKSSEDAEVSSTSDTSDQLDLSRVMWEMEKLLLSMANLVHSIGKNGLKSLKDKLRMGSRQSNSVIKGMSYINSELENISNQYNQMLESPSIRKTAAQQHMTSPSHSKDHDTRLLRYMAKELSSTRNKARKNKMKNVGTKVNKNNRTKNRVVVLPKQFGSSEGDFSNDETAEGRLFTNPTKTLGVSPEGEMRPRKLRFQKNLLKKFPLPADVFDLSCQTQSDKISRQHAHKNLLRSEHCKKGKKKK